MDSTAASSYGLGVRLVLVSCVVALTLFGPPAVGGADGNDLGGYRNGELLLTTSVPGRWQPAGLSTRIGASPRRDPTAGAPLGAVFSNVKVRNPTKSAGRVRLRGNSLCDDDGPFLGLGASATSAASRGPSSCAFRWEFSAAG